MSKKLFARFSLKNLVFICLLCVGILPLAGMVSANLPTVIRKIEQLTELERINELEEQVAQLETVIEHRKADLRTITALPGVAELFSDPAQRLLSSKKIKKRMGFMFGRWLTPESGVKAIFMVNEAGEVIVHWGMNKNQVFGQRALTGVAEPEVVAGWLRESKDVKLNTVFVAGVEQELWDKETEHRHFSQVILGIPAKNKDGAYGGAIFMRVSLAAFVEDVPYDFIVTGSGDVLHRYEKEHHHVDHGGHVHAYRKVSEEFPDFFGVESGRAHLILNSREGHKTAFVKIVDDVQPDHTVWLAHALHSGELEVWFQSFLVRFAVVLVVLGTVVFGLAMLFAGKTESMRGQLISGLTRLIKDKEKIELGWAWPAEVKELGLELETLGQALIESDQNLRQSERFLKRVLNGIQDGITVIDTDDHILDANLCIEEWYKDKLPLLGKKCYEVFHDRKTPCEECPSRNAVEQGVLQRCVMRRKLSDGKSRWLEVYAYPVHEENGQISQVVEFVRDVTSKKLAEEERDNLADQLAFVQKMEAVGTLAGGVAHDFNNILSVINGYAEMCIMQMEEKDPLFLKIKTILESGQRASMLTQQLLAFSRKQITHPQAINVSQTLLDVKQMLVRILGEDIEIGMVAKPDLWHICADQTQFEQIIINLAVNARDAMPKGGKLTFEANNVTLDEAYVDRHFEVEAGEYVLLAVSDSGVGMDKQTMAKIFEPFFTTKEQGKGTGLGLATVYGIVKQNNGEIMVYSEPGNGTTFKIYLPRLTDVPPPQAKSEEEDTMATGSETILLVEDDDVVRTMTVEILSSQGYSILEAADGEEALKTCKRYHGRIELLLTDVVMPKMNGAELAAQVTKLRPDIKVLFMSGYTDEAVVRHGILQDDVQFLQKPVTPKVLSRALRKALATSSS